MYMWEKQNKNSNTNGITFEGDPVSSGIDDNVTYKYSKNIWEYYTTDCGFDNSSYFLIFSIVIKKLIKFPRQGYSSVVEPLSTLLLTLQQNKT